MNNTQSPARYLITAALPYANGLKHIGHLAGAYIPADIYSRYLRATKKDVVFVCGSDEHGTAIPIQAAKENTTPQAIIDKYHEAVKEDFESLGIQFDIYHRTSSPLHHETAQEFFQDLESRGLLETKETEQFYDEETSTFLADRYIKGTCPNCGSDRAFGDQCENCGTTLSPDELINPVSTLSGNVPIKKKTTHWYLPLGSYEDFLRKWILEDHATDWRPNVLGQCKSWIEGGLQSRAVTRDLEWGIKLPIPNAEGKVLYVWFDAPIGYISATKQWAIDNNKDWKPYWYEEDTQLVHFIGKDNIVFHAIIFPIMLKLHGNILPDYVTANEFLNLEGDKMSTSRNWKLDMRDYINDFINKENGGPQCADMLRYYLTQIAPETKDSEFTWKGFQDAVNNELVAVFGNYVNRCLVLMHKLCKGKVPPLHLDILDDTDKKMIAEIEQTKGTIQSAMEFFRFRDGLYETIDLSRKGNKYMQEKGPWLEAKKLGEDGNIETDAQKRIDNCIHICLQLTANLAIFCQPFMPATAAKILHLLKVVPRMLEWKNAGKINLLSVGYSLRPPELLFRKIEDEEVAYQLAKLNAQLAPVAEKTEPVEKKEVLKKELIEFPDFEKIQLLTGTILAAEKVPKADKLLKLTVDIGTEKRTIVSGIALHYQPEEVLQQQVVIVANLAPRKLKGIESEGMILMAEDANGKLLFISPSQAASTNGLIVS